MMYGGGPRGPGPVLVLSNNTQRDQGRKVQRENIGAGKTIGDVVRTCLGPKAMLKMLMDPMGGIVMTNDGNAILCEITVEHPAAKTLIEIARTQDEEVGDGTTSVIVLTAEILKNSLKFIEKAKDYKGIIQWPYKALASSLEIIPQTLTQNCGASTIRCLTALRAKHSDKENKNWGINGITGELADMSQLGIWEPLSVKLQVYKTTIETSILLLRIDDIVSGSKSKSQQNAGAAAPTQESMRG
uniref:T-complex protein 1 subunit gamma n=1 Tax=Caligus clemensi TaxID=344056 RepID=C1C0N5_CALCM|nr:T-complex protein 1 subunit gamma [Caligus clemensi]